MRKLLPMAALIGIGLAAGPLHAQSTRMEGPRAPCRPAAMKFDQTLVPMVSDSPAMSEKVKMATDMRNAGMAACQAGNVQEGQRQIEQATAALRS